MRILVVGAGAVGGYLGARLLKAGEDVTFLARGDHARALREHGISIRDAQGAQERVAIPAVHEAEALQGPFDLALVAVKWTSLEDACQELPRVLAPHGVVAPLLNGLDSEDVVASFVGAQRTLTAVAYMSAGLIEPGVLYVHGTVRVGLAAYRPGQEHDLDAVAARFEHAGISTRRHPEGLSMLWEKMVWNAPFNALCAITGKRAGEVLESMPELVREAMSEVIAVAQAEGVTIPAGYAEAMCALTRSDFPDTEPSMLQDVRAGRETEVEILQGAVVERGKRLGVNTPVLRTLAQLVRALAR